MPLSAASDRAFSACSPLNMEFKHNAVHLAALLRSQVANPASTLRHTNLATDGRYLYWAEYGGDRVMRWAR
jgi:hypothetical protein